MAARVNITDRAKRYRAVNNVTGPRKCVLCGSRSDLQVMHLTGNESHGEKQNLAYGCRSCNQKLSAAFRKVGAGRLTNQYNPAGKTIPTFEQYKWAVTQGARKHYERGTGWVPGAHDEAGAVIHATPKHKRVQYAKMIAAEAGPARRAGAAQRRADFDSRWNPPASYRGYSVAKLEQIRPHVAVLTVSDDWLERDRGRRELAKVDHALTLARKREKSNPKPSDPWERFNDLQKQGFMKPAKKKMGTLYRVYTPHGVTYTGPEKHTAERHLREYGEGKGRIEKFRGELNPGWFSRPGRGARETTPASGGIAHHAKRPAAAKSKAGAVSSHKGYRISRTETGEYFSSLDPQSWYETKAQVVRAIDGYLKGRSNPGEYSYHGATTDGATFTKWKAEAARGRCPWCGRAVAKKHDNFNKHLRACPQKPASNPAAFDRCVKAVKKGGALNAYAICSASQKKAKKNPAASSAEVFEEFHGYAPSEVVTVSKKVHFHSNLAAAGVLKLLGVWGVDERGHNIRGFKGAILAFNEEKNQLFVEGGDQAINLADFGIKKPHEMETLGRVVSIGYHTNKTHLGEEGGEALYIHGFRQTNVDGKHVVVKVAKYPDLIYDVVNEQLLFSGGSYEILAEGINK